MYGIDSLWNGIGNAAGFGSGFSYGLAVFAAAVALGALGCTFLYLYRLIRAVERVAVRIAAEAAGKRRERKSEPSSGNFEPEALPFEPTGFPFAFADEGAGAPRFAPFEATFSGRLPEQEFQDFVDAEFLFDDDRETADRVPDDDQEVGLRQGVLTINFVHMSQQFQSRAQESVIEPTLEQMATSGEPVARFRVLEPEFTEPEESPSGDWNAEAGETPRRERTHSGDIREAKSGTPAAEPGSFYLMEHMAVLSTQFEDLSRIVSVTEVSPRPGCGRNLASETEIADHLRRLERIEEASIEMAAFSQAAGALGAQIDLLQHEYGDDDPQLAPRYLRLAELQQALGKPEQAERCQLRALEVQGKSAPNTPAMEFVDPLTDVEIQEFSTSMGSLGQRLRDLSPTDVEPSEPSRQHPPRT